MDKKQLTAEIDKAAINCCRTMNPPETLKSGAKVKFSVSGAEFMVFWDLVKLYALVSVQNFRKKNYRISIRMPEEDMMSEIKEVCYRHLIMYGPGKSFSITFIYLVQNYFYCLKTRKVNPPSKKTIFYCTDIDRIDINMTENSNLFEDCTRDIDFWSSIPQQFLSVIKQIVLEDVKLNEIAKQYNISGSKLRKNLYKYLHSAGVINKNILLNVNIWRLRFSANSLGKTKVKRDEFVKHFNIDTNRDIDIVVIPKRNLYEILKDLHILPRYFYDHAYRVNRSDLQGMPSGSGAWYKVDSGDWIELTKIKEHAHT